MGRIGPRILGLAAALTAVGALAAQAPVFLFGGVGLASDLSQVARRYPHSLRNGDILYVDPADTTDHISTIALSGAGPSRRLRVTFELERGGRKDNPACADVQRMLDAQFGVPTIRTFREEAVERADRQWRSATEEMTLVCFAGPRRAWLAEAVVINPVQ